MGEARQTAEGPLMPVTEIGDPRLASLFGASDPRDTGVRPAVRLPRKGLPAWAVAFAAILLGLLLFATLNSRRTAQQEPAVEPAVQLPGAAPWQAPPSLYIPPEPAPVIAPAPATGEETKPAAVPVPEPVYRPAPMVYAPPPIQQAAPAPIPIQQPRHSSAGAPLVIDTGAGGAGASAGAASLGLPTAEVTTRMRASALANRSATVPQGTMIPAVLETGFNSTQPGYARAIVSRDVRSFDGTRVLIPRGSRLVGEYRSNIAQGQKRAVIIWSRLIRPDGMTIAMDSPAVDTVGRGGVPASVNTHFFERLGDALLQTTIGIGSAIAQNRVAGPVVVVSGATGQAAAQLVSANAWVPTLSVPAGKSISIFVAHDLDFGPAGTER
jgi:type IV secretion system protein VirB10